MEGLFRRHMPKDLAAEYSSAALGFGDAIGLSIPGAPGGEWFGSVGQVQIELAAFGRALALSSRNVVTRGASPAHEPGYSLAMSSFLAAVTVAPDICMVEADGQTDDLLHDLSAWMQSKGVLPVTILHAAGTRPPSSVCRSVEELRHRPVTNACMIVETPDAMKTEEFDLVLQAALAGGNRLVIMRPERSPWPKVRLLDLIARHVPVFRWPGIEISQFQHAPGSAMSILKVLDTLSRHGKIEFLPTWQAVMQAAFVLASADKGGETELVLSNARFRKAAMSVLQQKQLNAQVTASTDGNGAGRLVLPIIEQTLASIADLLAGHDSDKLHILVDAQLASNRAELAMQIEAARYPTAAICCSSLEGQSFSDQLLWPSFAVDAHGQVVTAPHAIAGAIRFWSTAPSELGWASVDSMAVLKDLDVALDAALLRLSADASKLLFGRLVEQKPQQDPFGSILVADLLFEDALQTETEAERALTESDADLGEDFDDFEGWYIDIDGVEEQVAEEDVPAWSRSDHEPDDN